jgi:hypothetical protein
MRTLASIVAREEPDVLGVCEIEPGDALSLATRFALQWAYRGRQALFWRDVFQTPRVHDSYLSARPDRPFDRRGFVRADTTYLGRQCALVTTQFGSDRATRIPELRFARTQLRHAPHDTVVFAHLVDVTIAFADLGFRDAIPDDAGAQRVYVRGFDDVAITAVAATV